MSEPENTPTAIWEHLLAGLDHALRGQMNLLALTVAALGGGPPDGLEREAQGRLLAIPRSVSTLLEEAMAYSAALSLAPPRTDCVCQAGAVQQTLERSMQEPLERAGVRIEFGDPPQRDLRQDPEALVCTLGALLRALLRAAPPASLLRVDWGGQGGHVARLHDAGPAMNPSAARSFWEPFSRRPGARQVEGLDCQTALAAFHAQRLGLRWRIGEPHENRNSFWLDRA